MSEWQEQSHGLLLWHEESSIQPVCQINWPEKKKVNRLTSGIKLINGFSCRNVSTHHDRKRIPLLSQMVNYTLKYFINYWGDRDFFLLNECSLTWGNAILYPFIWGGFLFEPEQVVWFNHELNIFE